MVSASKYLLAATCLGATTLLAEGPRRVRLTETSVTETGTIKASHIHLKTVGYGLTYICSAGVGLGYTILETKGTKQTGDDVDAAALRHEYLDLSYTYGPNWLITGGASVGIKGHGARTGATSGHYRGSSVFLGAGYAFDWAEVYWIRRLNEVAYGSDLRASLAHYQLGLGVNF